MSDPEWLVKEKALRLLRARLDGDMRALLREREQAEKDEPCKHGWPPSWRDSCPECVLEWAHPRTERVPHLEVNTNRVTETVRVAAGDNYEQFKEFFGKVVRCTIPVSFWDPDWHDGMRARVYIGTVCSHHEGGVCLQPPPRAQGIDEERGQCFPLTGGMSVEVLPGTIRDYI